MTAFDEFKKRYEGARRLGDIRRRLRLSYANDLTQLQASSQPPSQAEIRRLEEEASEGRRSLFLAEVVQLCTAWETFLREKFEEVVSLNNAHLQRLLRLAAPPSCTVDTGRALLETAHRRANFQNLGEVDRLYNSILAAKNPVPAKYLQGVKAAAQMRHVAVHRAGVPTPQDAEYNKVLGCLDPVWVVAERPDLVGTSAVKTVTPAAGGATPPLTYLETSAESILLAARHIDQTVR